MHALTQNFIKKIKYNGKLGQNHSQEEEQYKRLRNLTKNRPKINK